MTGGTISAAALYSGMRPRRILLIAAMLTATAAALAQDGQTGVVIVLDRLHDSVTIRQDQDGGAVARYKAPAKLLETIHAGDKVRFSVSEANNTKTITKIEAQ